MGHLIYDLEIGAPTKNKILKQTNIYGFLQESNRTMDYLRGSSEANETYGKARSLQQRSRRVVQKWRTTALLEATFCSD